MNDMTSIAKRGLTSLDDQNTKQAPVPEIAKKLILKDVGVHSDEEKFITRTSGAVLRRSVRIPMKGFRTQRYSHPGYVRRDRRQGCHDGNRDGTHNVVELGS